HIASGSPQDPPHEALSVGDRGAIGKARGRSSHLARRVAPDLSPGSERRDRSAATTPPVARILRSGARSYPVSAGASGPGGSPQGPLPGAGRIALALPGSWRSLAVRGPGPRAPRDQPTICHPGSPPPDPPPPGEQGVSYHSHPR